MIRTFLVDPQVWIGAGLTLVMAIAVIGIKVERGIPWRRVVPAAGWAMASIVCIYNMGPTPLGQLASLGALIGQIMMWRGIMGLMREKIDRAWEQTRHGR